jgi:sensor histidine kinase YesM
MTLFIDIKSRLIIKNFFYTLIFNTIIAVFLSATGGSESRFFRNLIVSQCMGISIFTSIYTALAIFKTEKSFLQIIIIILAMIVGATLGTVLGTAALGMDPVSLVNNQFKLFVQIIISGLMFGSIISYIFISLGKMSDEKIKRLNLEKSAAEAELKLLQSQMEPHFLFNTLSNINGLIDADPEKAGRMLESFTAFLRASFLTARDRTITLAQEIAVVRSYLDVFMMRMGSRLRYTIDIPEGLLVCRIPPLLIQPLVENALKHGLEPKINGGEILIQGHRSGDTVRITVVDSGVGIKEQSPNGGIGLDNIEKRLQLLYGEHGRLFLEENRPSGVRAVIEILYETGVTNHSKGL